VRCRPELSGRVQNRYNLSVPKVLFSDSGLPTVPEEHRDSLTDLALLGKFYPAELRAHDLDRSVADSRLTYFPWESLVHQCRWSRSLGSESTQALSLRA
jgi:hypothetical protein